MPTGRVMDGGSRLPRRGVVGVLVVRPPRHPDPGLVADRKRHSGIDRVTIAEALDVARCFGWIDGQRKANDEVSFLQRYCRRSPKSSWSKINVAKVEVLTAAGRMRPAGMAEVEAAQADGRWAAAYESQRLAEVPPDLMAALGVNARADRTFDRLGKSDRYVLLLPLLKA